MIGKYSIVAEDVEIGEGSNIWHFCNLYGCKIGKNTQVGSYSEVKKGASIGDNCRLQARIFIPEGTQIGNNVFIGPGVTFLNDKYPSSEGAINGTWKLEEVVVEDDVSIGGGVIILPKIRIQRGAFIGAGSVVTKDVGPYSVVCGNPARVIGRTDDERYGVLIGGRE